MKEWNNIAITKENENDELSYIQNSFQDYFIILFVTKTGVYNRV